MDRAYVALFYFNDYLHLLVAKDKGINVADARFVRFGVGTE
jgi:hypothetical protein